MKNTKKENSALQKLVYLFDDGVFTEIDSYSKGSSGDAEAVAGFGFVNGVNCYAFAQNSDINNGAISVAQCSKIKKLYELATKTGYPIICIYDSNGVELTEGFEILSAYGEILKLATSVSGVIPQISIIDGACLGTSALMANMADIVIATKNSDFYVTVPSEITIDDSSKSGTIDIVSEDLEDAVNNARNIISMLPENNLEGAPLIDLDFSSPTLLPDTNSSVDDVINSIVDTNSTVELKADYGTKVKICLSTVEGSTVGIVSFNGEELCPKCAYKAESLIKLCDAFNIPVITIVNNNGVKKNCENEMLIALTKLSASYATATCPKISLITGQAIGSAYITLAGKGANADIALAWDNSVVSPLDVEAAVAFLYNDRLANGEDRIELETEYKETIGSAYSAAACGAIDDVIAPQETRTKLCEYLNMLSTKRETTIPRKHSVK